MTTPISNNSSVYDPSTHATEACDPNNSSCAPPPDARTCQAPRVVTLEPVVVEGSLAGELAQRFIPEPKLPPTCTKEERDAALSCATAGIRLVKEASNPKGWASIALCFVSGIACGKDLRALYNCKTE